MIKFIKFSFFKSLVLLNLFLSLSLLSCAKSPRDLAVSEKFLKHKMSQPQKPAKKRQCSIRFPGGQCAEFSWVKLPADGLPNSSEEHSFKLVFFNEATQLNIVFAENLFIDLWMPSMNHGSAPVKIQQTSESEILVYKIYFIMSGDWIIRFKQDGKIFFEYPVEIL